MLKRKNRPLYKILRHRKIHELVKNVTCFIGLFSFFFIHHCNIGFESPSNINFMNQYLYFFMFLIVFGWPCCYHEFKPFLEFVKANRLAYANLVVASFFLINLDLENSLQTEEAMFDCIFKLIRIIRRTIFLYYPIAYAIPFVPYAISKNIHAQHDNNFLVIYLISLTIYFYSLNTLKFANFFLPYILIRIKMHTVEEYNTNVELIYYMIVCLVYYLCL